ncbi:uncharacterized protein PAC_04082 [Phialocephala subalpina]|uniref:Uncharacterized protein n=1 Tax=Phialocephala subalpina TaxID=576137 RepID=A0A1L7WN57_9HELO|nr:uncharacterized protein PAC_04082 [Phialocephala subalpina]
MSFGFSVGDFLAAAALIKDIVTCLGATGGAASRYQELMLELDGLQRALDKIEHLEAPPGRTEGINGLKVVALSFESTKIGSALGKMIKWEFTMKDDVRELRTYLQMHTGTLIARLATEGLSSLPWAISFEVLGSLHTSRETANAHNAQAEVHHEMILQKLSDSHLDIHEVRTGVVGMEEHQTKTKLLDWLSPIAMHEKQEDTFSRHQKGTGEWLLEAPVFLNWLENEGSDPMLWCYGHPGAGKTIMSSIVINHLQHKFKDINVGVAFFYLDYKEERTAFDVLSSIARQFSEILWNEHPSLVGILDKLHSNHGLGTTRLKFTELLSFLSSISGQNPRLFVIIDALDECAIAEERGLILAAMKEMCGPSIRALTTSRPNYDDINTFLTDHGQINIVASASDPKVPVCQNEEQRHIYEAYSFRQRPRSANRDYDRRSSFWNVISKILKALETFPSKLENTFQETLDRIRSQAESDSALGIKILQWLSRSKRPLKVDELRYALAVEWIEEDGPPTIFDSNNILDPESLIDVCGGLVIIESASQIIKLAHFTIEEFFRKTQEALPDGDLEISRTCVAYLGLASMIAAIKDSAWALHGPHSDWVSKLTSLKGHFPFLSYASCHWSDHIRELSIIQPDLEDVCLRILNFEHLPGAIYIIMSRERPELAMPEIPELALRPNDQVTGLHFLVYLDLLQLASKSVEKGANVNAQDSFDSTPLHWAVMLGNEKFARFLLEKGAEVDAEQKFRHTPLYMAAIQGHEGIAKLLLENGAKVDCRDRMQQTPLYKATQNQHEDIVNLLLQNGANVNVQDCSKATPLQAAVMSGNEGLTNLLLENGARVDIQSESGMTALAWAVSYKYKNLVLTLLKAGASKELLVHTRHADESLVQLLESWKPETV